MTYQEKFVNDLFHDAVKIEQQYKIPHTVLIAQSALETGWGQTITPGTNMYFGIKAGNTWKGNRALITTTEYLPYESITAAAQAGVNFPQVLSITPVGNSYKWKIKDYFRAYDTPLQSLKDYANLINDSSYYKNAIQYHNDPDKFIDQLGSYATDPNYISKLKEVRHGVINRIIKLQLKKKIIPGIFILILFSGIFYYFLKK